MTQQPQTGKKIQNYVFNYADFLGSGNFSKCYKATNITTQEQVAIKIVELNSLKSKKLEELLFSQIAVLKQLNHPNVLRCLEVFTSNRNCYIVTELCNESDLETKIKKRGLLDERQIQSIVADVYKGLVYLASKGVVHRDLKIANIFLTNGVAKIADFGFAVYSSSNFKDFNIGSPLYMSPQGFLKSMYGPKTDVWSFGIMVYELYHNKTPFSRCVTEKELKAGILTPIRYNELKSSIPNEAKELIISCLQISEEKRPLVKDLENYAYFRMILGGKNNTVPTSPSTFRLLSPPRLQPVAQGGQPSQLRRNKNSHKTQHLFKSEQHFRAADRFNSPQKITFMAKSPLPLNNSSEFNANINNQNTSQAQRNQNPFSNTFSHNFQSPQRKRTNGFPDEFSMDINSSLNYTPQNVRTLRIQQHQNKERQFVSIPSKAISHLINCQINFKESVSILHYCRLIFKYLQVYKQLTLLREEHEKKHYAVLGQFLLIVLEEIYREIINKTIKYEGENPEMRERKLTEVTDQYRRKYSKELDQSILRSYLSQEQRGDLNITKIKQIVEMAVIKLVVNEQCSNQEAIVNELLLTVFSSTLLFESSYARKSFAQFQKNKDIEEILNKNKATFNFSSYLDHKNRIFNLVNAGLL